MSFSDEVQCYMCKDKKLRGNTLIVETPKGRFRLCRDCYTIYAGGKLNEDYHKSKDNVKLYGVKGIDAYGLAKKQEDFIKQIKEGRLNGRPQN